jgi:hypothetical protein
MHDHLRFLAVAHVVVLLSQAHWPIDHICIALAYSLTWSHAAMPKQLDAIFMWLSRKADEHASRWQRASASIQRYSPPKFRIVLIVDGARVRVQFQAFSRVA